MNFGMITLVIIPKYVDRAKFCHTDTDSFVIYIKTEDFYKGVYNDAERWFDRSNYDENNKRPLPIGKNEKVIGLFKDELGGKIITEYLMEDNSESKKAKGTKKCEIKRELLFENFKESLFNNQIILISPQRFKGDAHKVYTEEVNKIALSSNDGKRLQTFDKITTYPYETNVFKVFESKIMIVTNCFC